MFLKTAHILLIVLLVWSCKPKTSPVYQIESIHAINPMNARETYNFPRVKSADTSNAHKINSFLLSDMLEIEEGYFQGNIFRNVWSDSSTTIPMIAYLDYVVERSDDKVLSLSFLGEGCGAYCEGFKLNYNFDVKSGDLIELKSLFTQDGQRALLQELSRYKKEKTKAFLTEVTTALQDETLSENLIKHYKGQKRLYENCRTNFNDLQHVEYLLKPDHCIIYIERCANHANRALDDLGTLYYTLNLKEWENQLSAKARLIINSN